MDLKKTYKQLTGIDIDEQRQIWDERGKGYYGEYLLFCQLYKEIAGTGKILMNLDIPVDDFNTTEIDLLLIHETGLYVFEIKHHKGTIYGRDTDATWTQYFRTTENSVFKNPIVQNGYHIRALKNLFPDLPIRSFIVFTNHECDIRVTNTNPEIDVCLLNAVTRALARRFQNQNNLLPMEQIDVIFRKLSAYSKMQELVVINKEGAPFCSWIQPIIDKLEEKRGEVEFEKNNWKKNIEITKKAKRKGIIANVVVAIVCVTLSVVTVLGFQQNYDHKLQKTTRN